MKNISIYSSISLINIFKFWFDNRSILCTVEPSTFFGWRFFYDDNLLQSIEGNTTFSKGLVGFFKRLISSLTIVLPISIPF